MSCSAGTPTQVPSAKRRPGRTGQYGHLVFLAAAVPDAGDSLASLAETATKNNPAGAQEESDGEEINMRADGRMVMRPQSARATLFHDCPPDRADTAIALLRPQTPATGTQPVTVAAWRDIPSTYVWCSQDRLPYELVSPAYLEHASHVLTLPTGHCPNGAGPTSSLNCCGRSSAALGHNLSSYQKRLSGKTC
jgi:hypothetical protein